MCQHHFTLVEHMTIPGPHGHMVGSWPCCVDTCEHSSQAVNVFMSACWLNMK